MRCQQDHTPSGGLRRNFVFIFFFPSFWWLQASLACGHAPSSLCLPLLCVSVFSCSVCLRSPSVFIIRKVYFGFRAHIGNPGGNHLKILNLIKSTRTTFHLKWHFCRSWGDIPFLLEGWTPFNLLHAIFWNSFFHSLNKSFLSTYCLLSTCYVSKTVLHLLLGILWVW